MRARKLEDLASLGLDRADVETLVLDLELPGAGQLGKKGKGSGIRSPLGKAGDLLPHGGSALENDDGLDDRVNLAALKLDLECVLAGLTFGSGDLFLLGGRRGAPSSPNMRAGGSASEGNSLARTD